MTLDAAIAIGIITAGAAFGGYHYQQVHLPAFDMIQAEVLFDKCMRECHEVCEANEVVGKCKCDHCKKYIEGD